MALAAWQDPDTREHLEVRTFDPHMGIDEDPVTGSLNAGLAQWLMDEGLAPDRYTAHQGRLLGRNGIVHLDRSTDGRVWAGGDVVTCITGSVTL